MHRWTGYHVNDDKCAWWCFAAYEKYKTEAQNANAAKEELWDEAMHKGGIGDRNADSKIAKMEERLKVFHCFIAGIGNLVGFVTYHVICLRVWSCCDCSIMKHLSGHSVDFLMGHMSQGQCTDKLHAEGCGLYVPTAFQKHVYISQRCSQKRNAL